MPDEVRTTTRPPPPARPEATADTGRSTLVVVDPASVAAMLPADRQVLAHTSGLPLNALRRLADAGVPIVVGGSPSPIAATALAAARSAALGLPTRVIAGPTAGRLLISLAALVLAVACWVSVPFVGAGAWLVLSSGWWAMLPVLAGLGLALTGLVGLARALRSSRVPALVRREHGAALAPTRKAPAAWAALFALREASLGPDVPPAVQADLWSSLDAAEAALERGEDVDGWTRALREARDALSGADQSASVGARDNLHHVARRARAAMNEASS